MSKVTLVITVALLSALGSFSIATAELNEICKLPMYTGQGFVDLMGWVYNIETSQCEEFTFREYKGDLNENHFASKEACEKVCSQ